MALSGIGLKTNKSISRLDDVQTWHSFFGISVLCVLLFLTTRALDEDRWSDWGFGDAQTMLSLHQWEQEGWFSNRFLFIPQGHAKVVRLLDEPELRHHAHGISPSPRIGPRLWYTHYPSGYLIPYALLAKLGLCNIFHMRMLSVFFSIGAIILMYILFCKITSPAVSYFAVFFYMLSPSFLGYADSLANQPIDDFLRFAFMLAIVLSTRTKSSGQREALMVSAWVIEFFLSLSSFDSVFFVYLWLIGWDLLEHRGFRWKTYLIFGLAPLSAHFLQFLQNAWYLGFNDTIIDAMETFLRKSGPVGEHSLLISFGDALIILFNNLYKPAGLLILLFILYTVYVKFLRDTNNDTRMPSLGLLVALLLCGLAFVFIFPSTGNVRYEARQIAPSIALLVGAVTWSFLKVFNDIFLQEVQLSKRGESPLIRKVRVGHILLCGAVLFLFWLYFVFCDRKPMYDNTKMKDRPPILLAKKIKSVPTQYEPVIFDIVGFGMYFDLDYVYGYPQIHPMIEYYVGCKPILCFATPEGLATDLLYMINHSRHKFSPVVIVRDLRDIHRVLSILREKGALKPESRIPYTFIGAYALILTDYLQWETDEANLSL